jgi:hypothetical protein
MNYLKIFFETTMKKCYKMFEYVYLLQIVLSYNEKAVI